MLLANPKMSDKLQFVGALGSGRVVETSDKLKFVGHFQLTFASLSNSPTVSGRRLHHCQYALIALKMATPLQFMSLLI